MTKKIDKRTKAYKESQKAKKVLPKLEGNSTDAIKESKLRMDILEIMPDVIMQELYKIIGCQCTIDAYDHFQQTPFRVTREMQLGINDLYYNLFKERVRRTSCSSCMNRRITRIREELNKRIV